MLAPTILSINLFGMNSERIGTIELSKVLTYLNTVADEEKSDIATMKLVHTSSLYVVLFLWSRGQCVKVLAHNLRIIFIHLDIAGEQIYDPTRFLGYYGDTILASIHTAYDMIRDNNFLICIRGESVPSVNHVEITDDSIIEMECI